MPWVCPAFVIVYVGVFEWDELVPSPSLTRIIVETKKSYTILKMISYNNFFFSFQLNPNKQMHSNLRKRESLPVNASQCIIPELEVICNEGCFHR